MSLDFLVLMALCGLVTWLPRILPFVFSNKIHFPKKIELFTFHENQWPELKISELIACIPTLFVGYYSKDLMKIVVTGIISIALTRLFL